MDQKLPLDPAVYAAIAVTTGEKGKKIPQALNSLQQYMDESPLYKSSGRGLTYHGYILLGRL